MKPPGKATGQAADVGWPRYAVAVPRHLQHVADHPPDTIQQVPIAAVRPGYTPRLAGESDEHARLLAASDVVLPPVLVQRTTMRMIDGVHRLRAAQLRGEKTIAVQFFDGDDNAAFIAAVRANNAHGLPLTLADREAAAARLLAAHPQYSDRSIAAIAGLSAPTVREIRRRNHPDVTTTTRIGQDGRVRPLDSTEARRLAAEAIAAHPGASLRTIARIAGLSPTTVRDVRERMRRSDDPIPEGVRKATPAAAPVDAVGDPPATSVDGGSHDQPGAHQAGPGRSGLLENLRRDPSLRFTESGRTLLRLLAVRGGGPPDRDMLESLPPHCAYTIAAFARACASEWLDFASELERR